MVALASKDDCEDKEHKCVREMFTTHVLSQKTSEKLLIET